MRHMSETPFDRIESAQEYLSLLADSIDESHEDIKSQIAIAGSESEIRLKDTLQLVLYNLNKLSEHITLSRRILNDLRTLRSLLLGERIPRKEALQAIGRSYETK